MRAAALLCLVLAACMPVREVEVPVPAEVRTRTCLTMALLPDSAIVMAYAPPCTGPRPEMGDTVATWRIPSEHRRCVGVWELDLTVGHFRTRWTECRMPARRGG